jgi:hypothetical protein
VLQYAVGIANRKKASVEFGSVDADTVDLVWLRIMLIEDLPRRGDDDAVLQPDC